MTSQFNDITMTDQSQSNQVQSTSPSYLTIPKIRVIVRKRPLNKKELAKNDSDVVEIRGKNQVIVKELKTKVDLTKFIEEHPFKFDLAFDQNTSNEQIYIETVRPMIEAAFNKTKVTCFAYGQTGSGKTYTMMGGNNSVQTPGMYLLAAYDIFTLLQQEQYNGFTIWASFYEIYCGKLYDLLNERNLLTAREDGKQNICIVGLTEQNVQNMQSLMTLISYGLKARTVGVTGANSDSSRSHGIIQITIKDNNNNQHGKISFIDLAGSERAADTIDTNKQTRLDGAEINKSLLALKECIRALDQDKKHTPFRGSKLTLVLRDSFVGNCKTLMIANISPSLCCSEHTLNTLRYADRVKELRGKPDINIGSGNVNLNYDNSHNNNSGKDPQEVLANILMMPRQHNKAVRYTVDSNMKRVSEKKRKVRGRPSSTQSMQLMNTVNINNMNSTSNNCGNGLVNIPMINCTNSLNTSMNLTGGSLTMMLNNNMSNVGNPLCNSMNSLGNICKTIGNQNLGQMMNSNAPNANVNNASMGNQIANPSQYPNQSLNTANKSCQNQPGFQFTENKENIRVDNINMTEPQQSGQNNHLYNLLQQNRKSEGNANQKVMPDSFNFLNDYTSFTQKKTEVPPQKVEDGEDIGRLKEKYEELVSQILTEEKDYIEAHKAHIDTMVSTIKNEMNLIHTVEKQANVDEYVANLISIFSSQEEKIAAMKKRIIEFKGMLAEESELSAKISKLEDISNMSGIQSVPSSNFVSAQKNEVIMDECM